MPTRTSKQATLAALLGVVVLLEGCSATPASTFCARHDASPAAIQQRVMPAGSVDEDFVVTSCVSEAGAKDVYEEACSIGTTDPAGKPMFAAGAWTRGITTFVPRLVQRLAASERLTLATQFQNQGTRVYADANLARGIVYRQFTSCD